MVILRVADTDNVALRDAKLLQRRVQSARFVDIDRQHHNGAFVEDYLELEAEVADYLQYFLFVRLNGRDNDFARSHRYAAFVQCLDEGVWWCLGQQPFRASVRVEQGGPIFGRDPIEEINLRELRL